MKGERKLTEKAAEKEKLCQNVLDLYKQSWGYSAINRSLKISKSTMQGIVKAFKKQAEECQALPPKRTAIQNDTQVCPAMHFA